MPEEELSVIEKAIKPVGILGALGLVPAFEKRIKIFSKNPITKEGCAKSEYNYPEIYLNLVLTCDRKRILFNTRD